MTMANILQYALQEGHQGTWDPPVNSVLIPLIVLAGVALAAELSYLRYPIGSYYDNKYQKEIERELSENFAKV